MERFNQTTLSSLIGDVVFWSKHSNGKRVGKHLVVKALLHGKSSMLKTYVSKCRIDSFTGKKLMPLPAKWWTV